MTVSSLGNGERLSMEENKVTQIDEGRSFITKPSALTNDDIQHEYDYYQAQKILEDMRNHSLISDDEFNKITALNCEKFCPYLAKIMPNIT